MSELEFFIGDVDFGEGPRWHEGRLWYSDFYQAAIYAVDEDGKREAIFSGLPDRPSGLGWMPDGTLLVVSMTERKVLKQVGDQLVTHAELGALAPWHCNDMVVDARGNAYVGNFGFDLESGEEPRKTNLILVRPDGSCAEVANELSFPNGAVITPDGKTLIVGQTFGACYDAFPINGDGTLGERRRWADTPGAFPDGCTLDADGAIWFADALKSRVLRVKEGGEITHEVAAPQATYACALGAPDGRTLYVLTSPSAAPDEVRGKGAGAIYRMRVDVAHAGLP